MTTIRVGWLADEELRRSELYEGALHVLPPTDAGRSLCALAADKLQVAFEPHDPLTAQYDMAVEEFVERFGPAKPAFIHAPETMQRLRAVVEAHGCDLEQTYLDVPRLRGVTSDGYRTSGVGYAHHPHRDTWYSAPLAQLNWWLPIYPFGPDASMDFHPRYWSQAVANGSSEFDYYAWNAVGRKEAASHIHSDTRVQPKALEPLELEPTVRFVCDVGGAIVFSGAQLHTTVPNTSGRARYSIDFRTVNLADLRARRGAPNVDSHPHGTSLRDFRRASDLAPMPDDVVAMYDDRVDASGELVFEPS
jgi:hypothetical protein